MRRVVGVLFVLCVGLIGYWYYETQIFSAEVLTKFEVNLETEPGKAPPVSKPQEEPTAEENCLVWGPFSEKGAAGVLKRLKAIGIDSKTLILDRFASDRFIVYLGPFEGKTAALAFTKQFKQQGYRHARAITAGELSYGVEIEEFPTETAAKNYLIAGKGPKVKGIRVVKRLGETTDEVDLTLRGLTPSEKEAFSRIQKQFPSARRKACPAP